MKKLTGAKISENFLAMLLDFYKKNREIIFDLNSNKISSF